jgi:hypothetical protein
MIKGQKINVKHDEDNTDFALSEGIDTSLNRNSVVGLDNHEVIAAVRAF